MKLPKWKLKLMEDLIKGKVTLVKTRMGYQYKTKTKMSKILLDIIIYITMFYIWFRKTIGLPIKPKQR